MDTFCFCNILGSLIFFKNFSMCLRREAVVKKKKLTTLDVGAVKRMGALFIS